MISGLSPGRWRQTKRRHEQIGAPMEVKSMSPVEQTFLVQILIAAGVLFVIGFIGNVLSFSNRFVNALVTAIIFVLVYGGIVYAAFVSDQEALKEQVGALSQEQWIRMIGIAGVFVFVIDLVANMLSFQSRFMNALMTAIVFLVLFGGLMYFTGGIPTEVRVPA
jgi:lipid-A-disaccharide synthase-like uncharacterized protein